MHGRYFLWNEVEKNREEGLFEKDIKGVLNAQPYWYIMCIFVGSMTAKQLRFWNRIVAAEVFTVALLTFGLTVEPTASFWDAGEYIATSAKLQVGHPPGAPFFQMMGAFFALFASGPEKLP